MFLCFFQRQVLMFVCVCVWVLEENERGKGINICSICVHVHCVIAWHISFGWPSQCIILMLILFSLDSFKCVCVKVFCVCVRVIVFVYSCVCVCMFIRLLRLQRMAGKLVCLPLHRMTFLWLVFYNPVSYQKVENFNKIEIFTVKLSTQASIFWCHIIDISRCCCQFKCFFFSSKNKKIKWAVNLPGKRSIQRAIENSMLKCSFPWWRGCILRILVQTYRNSRYDWKKM